MFGFLTRPQAGILCIILLLPFAVSYNPSKRGLSRTLCVFIALISVVGLLKIYDYTTRTGGSRYFWSVYPYLFNIYDAKIERENLAVNLAPQDLVKYRAVLTGRSTERSSMLIS